MLRTRFCELFRIEYPIVSAGMGGVALADLAAAVSEAGGLGTIALAGFSPQGIHDEIAAARKITRKPIVANILIPFLRPGTFEALAQQPISAVAFLGRSRRAYSRVQGAHRRPRTRGGNRTPLAVAAAEQVEVMLHHASHCLNSHLRAGVRRVLL
jgi:NAD(P)H-dependent flavin oxidoreductase YrpB (nitropropane dioxygenase family)